MKIAVAGTGYVGLSVALLLAQHNEVHALDIVPEKVEMLNRCESPIVDVEITRFLDGKRDGTMNLDFQATTDPAVAYTGADYAVVATPTNYDERKNYFDTSSVEAAIKAIREYDPDCWIVIKSTIPVGYTAQLREKTGVPVVLWDERRTTVAAHQILHQTIYIHTSLSVIISADHRLIVHRDSLCRTHHCQRAVDPMPHGRNTLPQFMIGSCQKLRHILVRFHFNAALHGKLSDLL